MKLLHALFVLMVVSQACATAQSSTLQVKQWADEILQETPIIKGAFFIN